MPLILNVDDNEGARYAKSRILREAGFNVMESRNGRGALEAVRAHAPALVLLNVKLPDISGIDVCRQIKSDPQTATTLVLQVSAQALRSSDKICALESGADSYLSEPVEAEELIANIRALLRLHFAEKALRDAAHRQDCFLATLAHELRNPLAPIRNAIELLDPARAVPGSDQDAHALRMASRQMDHLGRLVDDLLDAARIARGNIELQKSLLDLGAVTEAALEAARPALQAKQQRSTVRMTPAPCLIVGDGVRVSQIISNLLSNAVKYTAVGGHIALSLETQSRHAVLRIADSGIGIEPDELPHVFELFVQSRKAAERADGGLGVGLALVKELAQLHGGSVVARSDGPGQGAEFTVRFPLAIGAQALPQAPRRDAEEGRTRSAPRRILITDDNVDCATSLLMLLEIEGHDVRMTHDALSAIDLAASFRPDVAILDIGLPGMDGRELARALRRHPSTENTDLIAVTGYGLAEDRSATSAAGFRRHFVKPAPFEDILEAISQVPVAAGHATSVPL
ncbi:response regulator [Paraburkholderia acidisoli]|uniref:histidine kinase n=1 Tax=Paraburkholderia acidisoli TaxID=2571748 RepID=A0A7Z2GK16_9BURK|nr:response regulator [Paraburkholderia acidisoli]QGZ63196.1 response regulator [Paraburkholderia acidisoli]